MSNLAIQYYAYIHEMTNLYKSSCVYRQYKCIYNTNIAISPRLICQKDNLLILVKQSQHSALLKLGRWNSSSVIMLAQHQIVIGTKHLSILILFKLLITKVDMLPLKNYNYSQHSFSITNVLESASVTWISHPSIQVYSDTSCQPLYV